MRLTLGLELGEAASRMSQWVATHVYTGTLLPATETDRLKDTGKAKDHLPIQSGAAISIGVGQGTTITLSATSQYSAMIINGTFTENLTADQTSIVLTSGNTYSYIIATQEVPTAEQQVFIGSYPERTFAHFNANDTHSEAVLAGLTCNLLVNHSVGGYLIDYSKPMGSELIANGGFDSADLSSWASPSTTLSVVSGQLNIYRAGADGTAEFTFNSVDGALYRFGVYHGSRIESGHAVAIQIRNADSIALVVRQAYINAYKEYFFYGDGRAIRVNLYSNSITGENARFDNVSLKEVTAHPITNYTTAVDLKQQSAGVQLISFQKSGGVIGKYSPLAMWFDGGVYVGAVNTGWVVTAAEDFAIEWPQYFYADGVYRFQGFGLTTTNRIQVGENNGGYQARALINGSSLVVNSSGAGWHHISITKTGNNFVLYCDGVASSAAAVVLANTTLSFHFSSVNGATDRHIKELGVIKIWQGDQYAKFDPAKSWAAAQKIIAQLEAL